MKARAPVVRFARALWKEWIRPLALPLLLVASAKSAIADINFVPSGSMKPTILEGDVVFINKLAYDARIPFTTVRVAQWANPERGDIVVCFSPEDGTRLVKRVIGLPGDVVELRNGLLQVNGMPRDYSALPTDVTRDLTAGERATAAFAREHHDARSHAVMSLPVYPGSRDFGPVIVPGDSYFVLGDNRDNSKDSRYFGAVARQQMMGAATAVVASADLERWLKPRFNRFFSPLE